jgi:hypothetical protein
MTHRTDAGTSSSCPEAWALSGIDDRTFSTTVSYVALRTEPVAMPNP